MFLRGKKQAAFRLRAESADRPMISTAVVGPVVGDEETLARGKR
jgi:hypothetical protein